MDNESLMERYRGEIYPLIRGAYSDEDQAVVLARSIGVRIGEKFRLKEIGMDVFRIARNALLERLDPVAHAWGYADPGLVVGILEKRYSVSPCPYMLVNGEDYYMVCWTKAAGRPYVARMKWRGDVCDCLAWQCGNFFRTESEARNSADAIFARYAEEIFEDLNRSDMAQG